MFIRKIRRRFFIIIFSCSNDFTGTYCHIRKGLRGRSWLLILIACGLLVLIGYVFLRYNSKIIRLKYLFAHHRLHEQISLEINSTNGIYSHLPTQENSNHDRSLDEVLADEIETVITQNSNNKIDDFMDDPFYVDEKQPIFHGDRPTNTGIL